MKQKHVDAAREVRLWLGTIIVPVAAILVTHPEIGWTIRNKMNDAKHNIKNKFNRKD